MKIPHSKPFFDNREAVGAARVIVSGQVAQGKQVEAFEREFARYHKINGAVAVSSGTAALHLALRALGVSAGKEVVIPSYVCTALLNAVYYVKAVPRIVDINADDFNISVVDVKRKMNKRVKAIIVPHMFGAPADIAALRRFGVPIIEDCAQAIGALYKGKKVGAIGTVGVFSFYATKMMTTGEGGMVISNNQALINKIRDWRDYDQKKDFQVRYNYKMTDFQAAVGRVQLKKLPAMIARRREIAKAYSLALKDSGVKFLGDRTGMRPAYFRYIIDAGRNKNKIARYLRSKGVQCADPVFKPLHKYAGTSQCPHTDAAARKALSIPIYPAMTKSTVHLMVSFLRTIGK